MRDRKPTNGGGGDGPARKGGLRGDKTQPAGRRDAVDPAYQRHYFTPEDEQVEPEEWLVPACDRTKQIARLPSIQIPPYLLLAMEKVIAGKHFPYEVLADLVRHALARHMEFLARKDGRLDDDLIVLLRGMSTLRHREVLRREAHTTLARLEHTMEQLLQDGDYAQAYRMGLEVKRLIDKMPASNTKNKFDRRFKKRYAVFLRSGGHTLPDASAEHIVTEEDFSSWGADTGDGSYPGEDGGDGENGEWRM